MLGPRHCHERAFLRAGRTALLFIAIGPMVLAAGSNACTAPTRHLKLATTSSVDNSGLLGALLSEWRATTGVTTNVAAVGSGIALDMLKRRQVDIVISHAPAREAALLQTGEWLYRKFMFNDFVLVGPPEDPAAVKGTSTVEDAMRRIAASTSRFISRGDSSGTHERERDLWQKAGLPIDPQQIVVAGSGMGATLRIAAATRAYTLTDRATFSQHAGRGDLAILYEGDRLLVNTYAVVLHADGSADARRFMEWLTDGPGRDLIDRYRTTAGDRAFDVWPPDCPRERPADVPHECRAERERADVKASRPTVVRDDSAMLSAR